MLQAIHDEDRRALELVGASLPRLVPVVEAIAAAFRAGGRLLYAGAGTSGRLGVLDAAECPPTFGVPAEQVVGLVAGGHETLVRSREGVEDSAGDGAAAVDDAAVSPQDVVVGISASRRTPWVRGALARARERGATTAFLVCNQLGEEAAAVADHVIELPTGPEAIAGSTRMKAGLSQKMCLTLLSTAAMVAVGKTWSNLMVDVRPTSAKLRERAKGMVMLLADVGYERAAELLAACDDEVKTAVTMARLDLDEATARERLAAAGGHMRTLLGDPPALDRD